MSSSLESREPGALLRAYERVRSNRGLILSSLAAVTVLGLTVQGVRELIEADGERARCVSSGRLIRHKVGDHPGASTGPENIARDTYNIPDACIAKSLGSTDPFSSPNRDLQPGDILFIEDHYLFIPAAVGATNLESGHNADETAADVDDLAGLLAA